MTRSHLPLLAALFLAIPSIAQQNPAPPIYPSPGNPADAQSAQDVSAQENSQMPVFPRACVCAQREGGQLPASWWIHHRGLPRHQPDAGHHREGKG